MPLSAITPAAKKFCFELRKQAIGRFNNFRRIVFVGPRRLDRRFYDYQFTLSQQDWRITIFCAVIPFFQYPYLRAGWGSQPSWIAAFFTTLLAYGFVYVIAAVEIYFVVPKPHAEPASAERGRFHDSHDEVFAGLEPYKHKPLGSPTSFRLLLLKSGSKGPLECDLIEHSVDTVLKFDAVSYTWGSPLPPRYIKCDGKSLQITQNCEDALYKIRLPSRGRLIWVDSICIDQTAENNEEKNQQLQLMGHIYGHASHVLAWIGPGNFETSLAFHYLRLHAYITYLPKFIGVKLKRLVIEKIKRRDHASVIRDIITREWFARVWTLQEVSLARVMNTRLLCGDSEIIYDHAIRPLYEMSLYLDSELTYWLNADLRHCPLALRCLTKTSETSASNIMLQIFYCHATNPKDKVYALQSMFLRLNVPIFRPDYNKTTGEIYWEAMLSLLILDPKGPNLQLLLLKMGADMSFQDVPSWVPDFNQLPSARTMPYTLDQFHATASVPGTVKWEQDGKCLVTNAAIVDKVIRVAKTTTWQPKSSGKLVEDHLLLNLEDGFEQTVEALQDWFLLAWNRLSQSKYEATGITLMEAIQTTLLYGKRNSSSIGEYFVPWLRMMMCRSPEWQRLHLYPRGIDLDGNDPNADYGCRFEREERLKEQFYDNAARQHLTKIEAWKILASVKTIPCVNTVHHYIWTLSRDCTLFIAESGSIGTGSDSIRTGDSIALIPGVSMPIILRSTSTVGHYKVVGSAYVHGMMDGEIWDHWRDKMVEVRLV